MGNKENFLGGTFWGLKSFFWDFLKGGIYRPG